MAARASTIIGVTYLAQRKVVQPERNAYIDAMSETMFLVEIQSWDWPLHVGVRPRSEVAGLEGDLLCVETLTIAGLILSPEEHRSKLIELRLHPLPRDIIFGDRDGVGSLYRDPPAREDLGFSANLFLPDDTLQRAIFCLGSIWRRVHMWVDHGAERSAVTDFGFSRTLRTDPT
jgi:hypothetical protein